MNEKLETWRMVEVGEANFESEVISSKVPVLVVFWAPWSRPCRVLGAVLDEVTRSSAGGAKLVAINADDHPHLSLCYGIHSIPTLLYFLNGTLSASLVGTVTKEAILAQLEQLLHPGSYTAPHSR